MDAAASGNEAAGRLHELKLRGLAPLPDDELTRDLIERGLAQQRGNFVTLTGPGREAVEAAARLPSGSSEEEAARRGYQAFLPLNVQFLDICADWQIRPGDIPNDHADAAYDWQVRERLERLHEQIGPLLRGISKIVPLFGEYVAALEEPLAKLDAGALEWFTSPRVDSYHTVWMHLHEEFRLALGISASAEAAQGG